MTRIQPAPAVAGIPIEHHLPDGIEVRETVDARWTGSRVTDAPLVIAHGTGPARTEGLRRIADESAYAAHFPYHLDADGRVVVGFDGGMDMPGSGPTHRFRQLLRADTRGVRYEMEYERAAEADWLQWTWQRIVLMHALPARGRGLVAHGTGFQLPDGGVVLAPGISGTGKSTLARALMADAADVVRVLGDDRVAITAEGARAWAWATPWASQADAVAVGDGPLAAIVLLERGAGGLVREVPPRAAGRLLMRTLGFPFWDEAALSTGFTLLERMLEQARLLQFTWAPVAGESRRLVEALVPLLAHG